MGKTSAIEKVTKPDTTAIAKPPTIKWADLPLISCLPSQAAMQLAKSNLEELDSIADMKASLAERELELKSELTQLQQEAGVQGLRLGDLAYSCKSVAGRKTLDKGLLVMNGVTVEQLEKSYKTGKEGVRQEFRNLKKQQVVEVEE